MDVLVHCSRPNIVFTGAQSVGLKPKKLIDPETLAEQTPDHMTPPPPPNAKLLDILYTFDCTVFV